MIPIQEIEMRTERFSAVHTELHGYIHAVEEEQRKLKQKHKTRLKSLVEEYVNAKTDLKAGLEESPSLFTSPKTKVLHGIKIGYRKMRGKIGWDNEAAVIARIKQCYDDEAGVLITVTEKPNKDALEKLAAKDLKKLGITVTDPDDQVVIKPVDSDIDKLVNTLINDIDDLTGEEDK